ncbi:MAG: YcxB family protein [Bacteroidetes bacterium]|nr:YcxB family protein [Bacteroidota bacterium]
MVLQFELEEGDYLTYQLFIASRSESIKKKRKKSRITVPIIYLGFAIFLFYIEGYFIGSLFLMFGMLWYLFFPKWEKKRYVKHYRNFIKENHSSKLGKRIQIEITDGFLIAKSETSESKTSLPSIQGFIELKDLVLIRIDESQSFLIPKRNIFATEWISELKKTAAKHNKAYIEEQQWNWE